MSDDELRCKCLEYAISILNYYYNKSTPKITHFELSELIFKYIKTGSFKAEKAVWPIF